MSNLANITISEEAYQNLLLNGAFIDIKLISVKIMPDDSDLADDENYKILQKKYRISRKDLEDYRFNKTTNK